MEDKLWEGHHCVPGIQRPLPELAHRRCPRSVSEVQDWASVCVPGSEDTLQQRRGQRHWTTVKPLYKHTPKTVPMAKIRHAETCYLPVPLRQYSSNPRAVMISNVSCSISFSISTEWDLTYEATQRHFVARNAMRALNAANVYWILRCQCCDTPSWLDNPQQDNAILMDRTGTTAT